MSALTLLSDDESLFHASVLEFARREIAPHVREMDDSAHFVPGLLDKLFALGVMGIEVPESHGGGGATFFHSVLAVEALARVDASVGVLVDVQNTLVINALVRWGGDEITQRYLPQLATRTVGRVRAVGSGLWQRRLRAHHTRRRQRPGLRPHGPQTLDHQRATRPTCSSSLPRPTPRPATRASRRFWSNEAPPGSRWARRKTSWGFGPARPAS